MKKIIAIMLILVLSLVLTACTSQSEKVTYNLRREGHPIITERVEGRNRYGEKCHWARYRMGVRG